MTPSINKLAAAAIGVSDESKKHDQLTKAAQTFVGVTFFGQMLKQMRESPFKDETFSGGRGGQAFQQMFDQQLAERMGRGSGRKLVDAMVNKIEGKKAYGVTRSAGSTFQKAA